MIASVVLGLAALSAASAAALPESTLQPLLHLGSTRFFVAINDQGAAVKASWSAAGDICRSHGMQLASVVDQADRDVLESHLLGSKIGSEQFWTSGNDLAQAGKFVWGSRNNQPFDFTYWHKGEPNLSTSSKSGNKDLCVEMGQRAAGTGLRWNDHDCSNEVNVLCEL